MLEILGLASSTTCLCESCQGQAEEFERRSPTVLYGTGEDWLETSPGLDRVLIHPSGFFGEGYLDPSSLPSQNLEEIQYEGERIPILFGRPGSPGEESELVAESDGGGFWIARGQNWIETNIDLVSSSFYELTRYEEIVKKQGMDGENAHTHPSTPPETRPCLLDPVVDGYCELLEGLLRLCNPDMPKGKRSWPGGGRFAVCLTHDIDQVGRRAALNWYQNELGRLWQGERKKIPGKLVRGARALLGGRSPFWTFDRIRSEESKRGLRSTFFFIPIKDGSAQHDYALTGSRKIQEVARDLKSGGWEVGLHTTGDEMLCEEVEAMTSMDLAPSSLRYHFLDFRIPESWRTITKEGIGVDCSLGYNEQAGFRAGTCHPFTLFDALVGEEIPVLELPLAIMDSTFYWYQKKSPNEIIEVTDKIMDAVEKRGGVLVVLWHNNYFDASFYNEWEGLYLHIIDEARRRGAFFGTAQEVSDFWVRRRSELGDSETGKVGRREEEA